MKVAIGGRLLDLREALACRPHGGHRKVLDEFLLAPSLARYLPGSVVHLPAFSGRAPASSPVVLTLHDLAFMADPSWFPLVRRIYYRLHFPAAARRADLVMADSEFTAHEAERLLAIPRERLRVVPLSSGRMQGDGVRARKRFTGGGPFILSVSTIEPRKNIPALLEAWKGIRLLRPGLSLVVAGRWGWGPRSTRNALESAEGVIWTDSLGSGELADAYSGAELLVYPSLYEGFGLPPLEAAAAGIPSVLGPAAALEEIYRPSGSTFCDGSPGSICEAVLEALEKPRDPDGLNAFASGYSDEAMARRAAAVYRELAG